MRAEAEALGFVFKRIGCPCNGSPQIFIRQIGDKTYTLTYWEKRDSWRIQHAGFTIAWGKSSELTEKTKELWG